MFQDFSAAVPNRQAGVQGSLWGWGERKDGVGVGGRSQEGGQKLRATGSPAPAAGSHAPLSAGNVRPDNGIQEAEILQEPATVLYRFVEKPSL